jgi:hypothetical protein
VKPPGAGAPGACVFTTLSRELMDALKRDSKHRADVAEWHVVGD